MESDLRRRGEKRRTEFDDIDMLMIWKGRRNYSSICMLEEDSFYWVEEANIGLKF